MTIEELNSRPEWNLSEYDDIDYYMENGKYNAGDIIYAYDKMSKELFEFKIVHSIVRSADTEAYDNMDSNALLDGEVEYMADRSCEIITDDDCYVLWIVCIGLDNGGNTMENKTNLIELTATFKTNEEASKFGSYIHSGLVGDPGYKKSEIALSVDGKLVTLIVGDEASNDSSLRAACAMSIAMASLVSDK